MEDQLNLLTLDARVWNQDTNSAARKCQGQGFHCQGKHRKVSLKGQNDEKLNFDWYLLGTK